MMCFDVILACFTLSDSLYWGKYFSQHCTWSTGLIPAFLCGSQWLSNALIERQCEQLWEETTGVEEECSAVKEGFIEDTGEDAEYCTLEDICFLKATLKKLHILTYTILNKS